MSLQIWLPLNGNLKNQGLNNVAVTNNGATVDSNGKIGNCYSFDGTDDWLLGTQNHLYDFSEFSFCCWIKVRALSQIMTLFNWENSMYNRIGMGYGTTSKWMITYGSTGYGLGDLGIQINQWYHFSFVKNSDSLSYYVNGQLKHTYNNSSLVSLNGNFTIGNAYSSGTTLGAKWFNGYLNDFRIYDHALSVKEIKELAKGLVVHYPLNGLGTYNFVKGSNTDSATTNKVYYSEQTGGSTRTIENDNGIPCVKITRNSTEHSGWDFFSYQNLEVTKIKPSTTYTISFDIIGSGSGSISVGGCFKQSNATNNLSLSDNVIQGSFNSQNWSHIVFTTTTKDSFDGITIGSQIVYMGCAMLRNTGAWVKVKNFKVEEGNVNTPWTPNPNDPCYVHFGADSDVMPDVSGITQEDATIVRDVYCVTNSPRYLTSTRFTHDDKSVITLPNFSFENMDYGTLSFWINVHSFKYWSHFVFFANSFNWTGREYDFIIIATNGNSGDTEYDSKAVCLDCCSYTNSYTMSRDTWYHVVITWDAVNYVIKRYVNGTLHSTNDDSTNKRLDTYRTKHNNHFLGNGYITDNNRGYFDLSDFRIYATALSADDVKELYNTPISIAKNGTLFTQGEYVEVS